MWKTVTPLYDHQQRAVEKLLRPRVGGLFMEMGTGKTRSIIELACHRQAKIDRVIYYCPVSLKETIRREFLKHTDGGRVYAFDDRTTAGSLPEADWYIIGIESMSSSDRVVLAANALTTENSYVVVDESSYLKFHRSRRTERITHISERARYRAALSGTPVSQGVVDLYAQMRFLSPKILGYHSFYSFAANHLEYSEKYPGMIVRALNTKWLAAKIQPYVYQVTKKEALTLPAKRHDVRYCSMTAAQRRYYQQAKEEILLQLEQSTSSEWLIRNAIFRLFGALQQIVCGFWNRRDPRTDEQTLIEFDHDRLALLRGVVGYLPENEKVIIWSKFHYSIRQIVAYLQSEYGEGSTAEFHGRLSEAQRNQEIERWRGDGVRFLVATQAAGGHGLTLNEAAYSIFYSNEFKYATRIQAEDRNHRIGQERPVTYIDLVCSGTIDDRIQTALARKANAAEEFKRQVNKVKDDRKLVEQMIREL